MLKDGKEHKAAIYIIVNKKNKAVAYSGVNVPAPIIIREDENPDLYNAMKEEGAAVIADPTINFVTGLGLGHK